MADVAPPPGFVLEGSDTPLPPPGFELESTAGAPEANAATREPASYWDRVKERADLDPVVAGLEGAANLATGAVGAVVGGLAGVGRMAADAVTGRPEDEERAGTTVNEVASALTYQPRTRGGQNVAKGAAYPFEKFAEGTGKVGEVVSDVAGPVAGATVNTALQAAPALLFRKPVAAGETAAGETAAKGATTRAKDYVARRTNLAWDSLPDALKQTLEGIAKDAKSLEALDPAAVQRQARLDRLGLPATRGQVTRDLPQLTREENISKSEAGQPIRDITAEQDRILGEHIDTLRTETGGRELTPQGLGESVQGALRGKKSAAERRYDKLYAEARKEGLTEAPVETRLLDEWLQNPTNKRNASYLVSALDDYRQGGKLSINALEEIRKEATAKRATPGSDAHYAGEAVKVIDAILDEAGSGKYKEARAAFRKTKQEFEGQGLVEKLSSDKRGMSDRQVALEDTFQQTVLNGTAEQLRAVQKSLVEGGSKKSRANGAQAWKDLQASTLAYLKDKAHGATRIEGERGQSQFNASFIRAVEELDKDGKLGVVFDEPTAAKVRELVQATRDVRTKPAGRVAGSDTTPRIIAMLEKAANIPFLGAVARGTASLGKKVLESGKEAKDVATATSSPLQTALQDVEGAGAARARSASTLRALETAGKATAVPLAAMREQQ